MSSPQDRLERSLAAIDAANAEDPNVISHGGVRRPKELVHAEVATRWLLALDPGADDRQRLAVRAHHLRRWIDPRSDHPPGRAGYLRWRAAQKRRHAEEAVALLRPFGWDDAAVEDVAALIRKDDLGSDDRAQAHEDALCLTFLELQLDDVVADLGADRATAVLVKTLAKMSPRAVELVAEVPLAAPAAAVVRAARGT